MSGGPRLPLNCEAFTLGGYHQSGAEQMRPRSREEIMRFFEGLEMIPPGLKTGTQVGVGPAR